VLGDSEPCVDGAVVMGWDDTAVDGRAGVEGEDDTCWAIA